MTILAFGAAGPIGGLATAELARHGATVRGFVTSDDRRQQALDNGAAEVAIGDLADPASVARALDGVDAVFYIAPVDLADQGAIGCRLVEQVRQAGIGRLVFSSVIHPVLPLPNHAAKAPVEAALVSSGLDYAILHPGVLYQNFDRSWPDIVDEHVLAEPWSNDTRHARVDYRDVAEVAAIALLEDRLVNGTYELCAEGEPDRPEIAAMLSGIVGREVAARRIDPATLGDDAKPLMAMFEHYDREGLHGNPLTLRAILGREPRSLRDYFGELAARNPSR